MIFSIVFVFIRVSVRLDLDVVRSRVGCFLVKNVLFFGLGDVFILYIFVYFVFYSKVFKS